MFVISDELERKLRILAETTQQSIESTLTAIVDEKYATLIEQADDFARMAADPDIQRDLELISSEFADADADGLGEK